MSYHVVHLVDIHIFRVLLNLSRHTVWDLINELVLSTGVKKSELLNDLRVYPGQVREIRTCWAPGRVGVNAPEPPCAKVRVSFSAWRSFIKAHPISMSFSLQFSDYLHLIWS